MSDTINALFPPNRSQKYYEDMLATIEAKDANAQFMLCNAISTINGIYSRCEAVCAGTTVPPIFLALRQMMEASGDLTRQPFDGRPWNVANRIYKGVIIGPYISWQESAVAFIAGKAQYQPDYTRMDKWPDWRIALMLECGNGPAYANMNRHSPYLVGLSNMDSPGKYIADGKFDPAAQTKQVGAALLLKAWRGQSAKADDYVDSTDTTPIAPQPASVRLVSVDADALDRAIAQMREVVAILDKVRV